MCECAKQLTDPVAMPTFGGVAGGAVGGGEAQRRSTIGKMRELRVFAKAREHAASGIGDDEFEGAGFGAVGDQPGCSR